MSLKPCNRATAAARLAVADSFMEQAELARTFHEGDNPYHTNSLVTTYVHAGIAASAPHHAINERRLAISLRTRPTRRRRSRRYAVSPEMRACVHR